MNVGWIGWVGKGEKMGGLNGWRRAKGGRRRVKDGDDKRVDEEE